MDAGAGEREPLPATDTPFGPELVVPVGVVILRRPSGSRWRTWEWLPRQIVPGLSRPIAWRPLPPETPDEAGERFLVASLPLVLHRTETQAYLENLATRQASVYVVMTENEDPQIEAEYVPSLVSISPHTSQDCLDSGEDLVERVPMPDGLRALVEAFTARHHVEERFVKRQRDRVRINLHQDGVGDARIRQAADVYRRPGSKNH